MVKVKHGPTTKEKWSQHCKQKLTVAWPTKNKCCMRSCRPPMRIQHVVRETMGIGVYSMRSRPLQKVPSASSEPHFLLLMTSIGSDVSGEQYPSGRLLPPSTQTVCPPALWEALQEPQDQNHQVQEQLFPYSCLPAELHPWCPSPLHTNTHTRILTNPLSSIPSHIHPPRTELYCHPDPYVTSRLLATTVHL